MDKKVDLIGKLFISYVLILAICFLLYSLVVLPTNEAEKVNAIIGLLGWSATIFTPIAALFLLNQWKNQTHYNARLELLSLMYAELNQLTLKIIEYRENNPLAIFLISNYEHQKINSPLPNDVCCDYPDFSEIRKCLENMRALALRINIYDENLSANIFTSRGHLNSFTRLEKHLEGLDACSYISKHKPLNSEEAQDPNIALKKYHQAFYCCSKFYNYIQAEGPILTENPLCNMLNTYLMDIENDIKQFRIKLNR